MAITESTNTGALGISVAGNGAGVVVSLTGRVSIDSSPDLRNRFLAILQRQPLRTLTVDLAGVSYIDCSGLATLVEALKLAHARTAILQLRGLHDGPRYLLEVTGLLGLFESNAGASAPSASRIL